MTALMNAVADIARHRPLCRATLAVMPTGVLAACEGEQSMFTTNSPEAGDVVAIWWLLFWSTTGIFFLVTGIVIYALLIRRRRQISGQAAIIVGGLGLPAVFLPIYTIWSLNVGVTHSPGNPEADLVVEVVGHQFWWEVRYPGDTPDEEVVTANEVYLPAGRTVRIELEAEDVIHSFWVPGLGGKTDMIPGRRNTIQITPQEPGVFRGQCAEFCGAQHANMAFYTVVQPAEEFDAWLERQRQPAPEPQTDLEQRGRQAFMQAGCGACHTIRGTEAQGRLGPDLSNLGARRTIAAGMLDNNLGNLTGWIAAAQEIKPGNRMPSFNQFDGETLRAIGAYLNGLE